MILTTCTGQFLPLEGANPTIGAVGTPEHVEEDRVEVLVLARSCPVTTTISSNTASSAQLASLNEDGVEMGAVLQELKKVRLSLSSFTSTLLVSIVLRNPQLRCNAVLSLPDACAGPSIRGGRV